MGRNSTRKLATVDGCKVSPVFRRSVYSLVWRSSICVFSSLLYPLFHFLFSFFIFYTSLISPTLPSLSYSLLFHSQPMILFSFRYKKFCFQQFFVTKCCLPLTRDETNKMSHFIRQCQYVKCTHVNSPSQFSAQHKFMSLLYFICPCVVEIKIINI